MTDDALIQKQDAEVIASLVINGDLSKLTPQQQVWYYNRFCNSLGLNPLTKPFDVVDLKGKKVLYANKNCGEQLRQIHGVSFLETRQETINDIFIVTVKAQNAKGRVDTEIGAVPVKGLAGDALANAMMKAVTKAKRRATLSICSVGLLDESELESIPDAEKVELPSIKNVTPATPAAEPKPAYLPAPTPSSAEYPGPVEPPQQTNMRKSSGSKLTDSDRSQIVDMTNEMIAEGYDNYSEKRQTLKLQKGDALGTYAVDEVKREYEAFLDWKAKGAK